ncbi:MAG: hypothetical protein U9N30_10815 [Campylobacterota bacterium]|nr:hypothetical protein [Campylobacterota bacterium]
MSTNKQEELQEMLSNKNVNHNNKTIHEVLKSHKDERSKQKQEVQTKTESKLDLEPEVKTESDSKPQVTQKEPIKHSTQKRLNTIDIVLYSLIPLIVMACAYVVYLIAEVPATQTVLQEPVVKPTKLAFSDLPQEMQNQYVDKIELSTQLAEQKKQHNEQLLQLEKKLESHNTPKELPLYNSLNDRKVVFKNSSEVEDTLKCYDVATGKIDLTQQCKNNLKAFIQKHKGVTYYEIVGVVGKSDTAVLAKSADAKIQQHIKFVQSGIAQNRANEMAWFIRKLVGKEPIIRAIAYPVESLKENKGAIVRIYK